MGRAKTELFEKRIKVIKQPNKLSKLFDNSHPFNFLQFKLQVKNS